MHCVGLKLFLACVFVSSFAYPCGKGLGEIRPGNKIVGIEVKDGKKGSKWLMDDDGMMVLSLVAAYCNNPIPYLRADFTPEQEKCARDHQETLKIPYDEQISTYYFSEKDKSKGALNRNIKAQCGFDMLEMWQKSADKRNAEPVACVEEVRGIVKKAFWRSEEYLKEELDPKNLANINGTPDQKKAHIASLKADADYAKSMHEMFSESPVSVGKFEKWLAEIGDMAKRHGYQVLDNPNDKFDPEKQQPLPSILFEVGAKLPGLASSKCGRFPVEIIKQLQSAMWDIRGTGPGLQGGPAFGGNQGNEAGAGK